MDIQHDKLSSISLKSIYLSLKFSLAIVYNTPKIIQFRSLCCLAIPNSKVSVRSNHPQTYSHTNPEYPRYWGAELLQVQTCGFPSSSSASLMITVPMSTHPECPSLFVT